MPILILGFVALAIFVAMGLMLFSATIAENRDRNKRSAAAKADIPQEEAAKTRAASA
jgi:hypothetical protein